MFVARFATVLCALIIAGCSAAPTASSPGGPGRSPTTAPGASARPPAASTPIDEPSAEPTAVAGPTEPVVDGLTIGGIVSGLEGTGLVLYSLGVDEPILQNGPFTFAQPLPDGIPYEVRVTTQPSGPDQVCTITNGNGTLAGANVTNVLVTCVTQGANTSLDPSFGKGGKVTTAIEGAEGQGIAIQADGKIVLAGRAIGGGGIDFTVVRYEVDGSPDPSFGTGGTVMTDLSEGGMDEAFDVAIQPDGKIVVVGTSKRTKDDFAVVRYNADGSLDTAFGSGGIVTTDFREAVDRAQAVVIQPDGGILVAGHAANGTDNDYGLARYTALGALDSGFGTGGTVTTDIAGKTDLGQAIALTPDGHIVVAGRVAPDGGASSDFGLVRYAPDGTLDTSFGDGGIVRTDFANDTDDVANGVVVQADGSIVAAGYSIGAVSFDFALAGYRDDGQLDASFGTGGLVTTDFGADQDYGEAVALGPSGTIIVVGRAGSSTVSDLGIARYTSKGSLDTTFGTGGLVTVDFNGIGDLGQDVAIQTDGKIVTGGYAGNGTNSEFALVRAGP